MTSKEIKEKREALGLTQKELAALIGVGKNTIYNYEAGATIPDSKVPILKKILNPNNGTDSVQEKEETYKRKQIKTPHEEQARFEEVIAYKVAENLKPFIQEKTDELLAAVMRLHLELNTIRNKQAETHEKVEVIEKRG